MDDYEFDVALTFAGEDRSYVQDVAATLRLAGIRVFYDQYEQASLWGEDLSVYLDKVYRKKSQYVILFGSTHYIAKVWTSYERRSALARAIEERGAAYILPVRLDDAEVPGLPSTIAFLDGRALRPQQIAEFLRQKMGLRESSRSPGTQGSPMGVPLTEAALQALITRRPPGWEYLHLAGRIWQGVQALQPKILDYELGYAPSNGAFVGEDEIHGYMRTKMNSMLRLTAQVEKIIGADARQWALGEDGVEGDPIRISRLCDRFVATFEDILDWALDIRGTVCPSEYANLFFLLSQYVDQPVVEVQRFAERLVTEAEKLPAHFADSNPDKGVLGITISLKFELAPQVVERFDLERHKLGL